MLALRLWTFMPGRIGCHWMLSGKLVGPYRTIQSSQKIIFNDFVAFSYNLGTLNVENESNELCDAFRLVSQSVSRMSFFPMLRFFFPILRIFVSRCRAICQLPDAT